MQEKEIRTAVKALGWSNPRMYRARRGDTVFTWYESRRSELTFIQVNTTPCICACVYVIEARICSGWHVLFESQQRKVERTISARAQTFLDWNNFKTARTVDRYVRQHPECYGYTLERLQHEREPYVIVCRRALHHGSPVCYSFARYKTTRKA